jgi:phosphoribosylanthranilate isomerase
MFVKICGITNREDAMAAIDAGAGALGFIFHKPSPRYAAPDTLAPWIGEIPSNIWKVGVFVNESAVAVESVCTELKLDVAQLHGDEPESQYPHGPRIWKAIRVGDGVPAVPPTSEALLLDGPRNGATFDWSIAKQVTGKVIVAGGLTPENVRAAVEQTNPWGVDTASGVEFSAGRKDHARMKQFIKAALGS